MNLFNKKYLIVVLGIVVILLSVSTIYSILSKSNITTPRGAYKQITILDLENGIKCETSMSSSIENGWNSDDQFILFGNIEKFKAGEKTSQPIKLTNEGKTLQQEYPEEGIKEFEVIKQNDSSVHAIFEGKVNPYTEYFILDLDLGEYRYTRTNFYEGNGLSISRGKCYKNEY